MQVELKIDKGRDNYQLFNSLSTAFVHYNSCTPIYKPYIWCKYRYCFQNSLDIFVFFVFLHQLVSDHILQQTKRWNISYEKCCRICLPLLYIIYIVQAYLFSFLKLSTAFVRDKFVLYFIIIIEHG